MKTSAPSRAASSDPVMPALLVKEATSRLTGVRSSRSAETTPLPQAETDTPAGDTTLCSREPVAATVDPTQGEIPVPYCALPDEPISCERPMTALVSEPEATRRVERNVLE